MTEKLDPTLLSLVESDEARDDAAKDRAGSAPTIDVLVALTRRADAELLADLASRGLSVRSVVGDILTGSVDRGNVRNLAAADDVVRIDASVPMYLEQSEVTERSRPSE